METTYAAFAAARVLNAAVAGFDAYNAAGGQREQSTANWDRIIDTAYKAPAEFRGLLSKLCACTRYDHPLVDAYVAGILAHDAALEN